jgi:hypothetical protein
MQILPHVTAESNPAGMLSAAQVIKDARIPKQ